MEIYPTKNHIKFSFDSNRVDIEEVICKANQSINMDPQTVDAKKYYNVEDDYGLDESEAKLFILDHNTTQGIVMGKHYKTIMQIVIPALSTDADIAYAFHLVNAVKELYPNISIRNDDAISDFSDKGIADAVAHCRNNMRIYLTGDIAEDDYDWNYDIYGYSMGTEITIDMLKKQFAISDEDVDINLMVDLAFSIFCRLQWMAAVLPHAEHSIMTAKYALHYYGKVGDFDENSSMEEVVTILNSNLFVNVSESEIVLSINGQCKAVSHEDFYTAALRCDNIEVFSYGQYAITEMTPEEWGCFCDSVPGKIFDGPKTFILRWNPAVSSLTRKRYSHCLKEYGENWGINWAISDWQNAQKGDTCYMLLEGPEEEHPGIILKGVFLCNPYTDKDWRGTENILHYVDVDCLEMADINERAWITPQQLEVAIPDFNWYRGRSGEQLTAVQAESLNKLWNIVIKQIEKEYEY